MCGQYVLDDDTLIIWSFESFGNFLQSKLYHFISNDESGNLFIPNSKPREFIKSLLAAERAVEKVSVLEKKNGNNSVRANDTLGIISDVVFPLRK